MLNTGIIREHDFVRISAQAQQSVRYCEVTINRTSEYYYYYFFNIIIILYTYLGVHTFHSEQNNRLLYR